MGGRRSEPRVTILIPADDPQAGEPVGTGPALDAERRSGFDIEVEGSDAEQGFPVARFGEILRRLPRYLRLAWGLAGEPTLPRSRRAAVVAAAAYLASPVDLIPGVIPVVGQLDDVAVTVLALRAALRALDAPTRARLLSEAGLGQDDLDRDLETAGLAALWLAREGAYLTVRLAGLAARAATRVGRAGGRAAMEAAAGVARATGRAAPRVAEIGARAGGSAARVGASAGRTAAGTATRALSGAGGRLARIARRSSGPDLPGSTGS